MYKVWRGERREESCLKTSITHFFASLCFPDLASLVHARNYEKFRYNSFVIKHLLPFRNF